MRECDWGGDRAHRRGTSLTKLPGHIHFPRAQRAPPRKDRAPSRRSGGTGIAMSRGKICCLALLALGALALAVTLAVVLTQPRCAPQQYLHGAVAADTESCSLIGRYVHGAPAPPVTPGSPGSPVCVPCLGLTEGTSPEHGLELRSCPVPAPGLRSRRDSSRSL